MVRTIKRVIFPLNLIKNVVMLPRVNAFYSLRTKGRWRLVNLCIF